MAKKGLGILSVVAGLGALAFGACKLLKKDNDMVIEHDEEDVYDEEEQTEDVE